MAVAVERIAIPLPSVAFASSSSGSKHSVSSYPWRTASHKLLGGTFLHSSLRARRKMQKPGMGRTGGTARAYENRRSNPIDDPFNYGEDEDMEIGGIMSEGKQNAELPRPPNSKRNKYGFLEFPPYYNVEIASLGAYNRQDVRRCLCWVNGGVYENLLFFPAIQLLINRYPGVKIDVVAGERGKQAYEMNKYINNAFIFDTDAEWTVPADLTDFLGVLRVYTASGLVEGHVNETFDGQYIDLHGRSAACSATPNEYYDLILSTKYAGFKHCATLFMIGGRTRRVSYVHQYHSEWVSNHFLTEAIVAPSENLADSGYNMYGELLDYVAQPARGVPQEPIPPLQIGVSKRVRSVVKEKEHEAGLVEGKFVVFHGIQSDSAASMTSRGDTDSLLPHHFWGRLKTKIQDSSGVKVVIVIPHQKERPKVFEACGEDVSVIFITTPGQLGSLIRDSAGVVSTNTAAMLMAAAMKKPSVALFGSAEKASLFVPPSAEKTKVVSSTTGRLADVDIDDASSAWRFVFEGQLVLA